MHCGGGGGGGGETCQPVRAPGPELSTKLGIKYRDGQKIGWEFKEALSQHGRTADRMHAGLLPSPDTHPNLLPGSPRYSSVRIPVFLQSDWLLVKAPQCPQEMPGRRTYVGKEKVGGGRKGPGW